ncbi:DoxX family protein [Streptomyces genisteinicus]|uniref:DoxX family protein n=1 Tax=Streptomyces genisteinicus TaxID=2768068 RepID=A0A7H0I2C5_9ACTN|nr:DoxX family protein [Streptomyces genisteinicus]
MICSARSKRLRSMRRRVNQRSTPLKLAGTAGLLLGLVDTALRPLGAAAAGGLVLLYLGALAFHVRARVFRNLAFPGFYLATAVASLALALSS